MFFVPWAWAYDKIKYPPKFYVGKFAQYPRTRIPDPVSFYPPK